MKDHQAFQTGEGPCYTSSTGQTYTRADFLNVANGQESVAEELFNCAEGETPEEVLEQEAGRLYLPTYRYDPVSHWHWLEFYQRLTEAERELLWNSADRWRWKRYRQQYGTNIRFAKVPYGIAYTDGGECNYSEERAERYQERAEKARERSTAAYERSNALVRDIPLGQPILPGKRGQAHRNTLARSHRQMDKSCQEQSKAEHLQQRAEASRRHQQARQSPGQMRRRINTLRADVRSYQRSIAHAPERGNESLIPEWERRISILNQEISELEAELEAAGGILADRLDIGKGDIVLIDGHTAQIKTQPRKGGKTFSCILLYSDGTPWVPTWELQIDRTRLQKRLYTAQEWKERQQQAQE